MKIRAYMIFMLLGLLFAVKADSGNIRQAGEGRYILENEYLEVELNALKGGGIENIRYKPANTSLTGGSQGISFEDRIYRQRREGSNRLVETEYFISRPYSVKILKDTGKEISVEVSSGGLSDFLSGLKVSKVYTLRDKTPALFVEERLENTSASPLEAGIWTTNFFRISGALPERNKYYTPTEKGLREIMHPGADATIGGIWTLTPVSDWKAIVGDTSRVGIAAIFEANHLSSFLDWYSDKGNSTFEWMIREQKIEPQSVFKTGYVIFAVSEFNRIDNVMDSRIVGSIEYQPEKVKAGEESEITYRLSCYENDLVKVKERIKADGKVIKENVLDNVKLEAGKNFTGTLRQKIEKEGVYWVEIEVVKDNKLLGITRRPLVAGNFEANEKTAPAVKISPEESFWFGLKNAGVQGWQDVKFTAHRITPQAGQKDTEKNMVTMGDFEEKDPEKYVKAGWNLFLGKGGTLTEEAAHGGKQSLKMIVPADSKTPILDISVPLCKVEAGKEYKVTFWAKAVEAVGTYSFFPEYAYYTGSKEKPKYVGRVFKMIKTPTFDWEKIERIIIIPEGAEWLKFSIATKAVKGDVYIDDISIMPMPLSEKETRRERAYIYNKSMDTFFNVSEEYETPHVKWLKPYSKGKLNILYLASMERLDDTIKRDLVELAQRADMNYKFIPMLRKRVGERMYIVAKELEPYISDVAQEELKKDYDVIIISKLNFKDVQEELIQALLAEVKGGKGLVMLGCSNIPQEMENSLTRENQVKIPDGFSNMPEINTSLKISRQIPLICKIWQLEKGRVSKIDERNFLYPCVPADKTKEMYPNYYGKEVPYWEYKMFPLIKSLVYLAGKESDVKIKSFTISGTTLKIKAESGIETSAILETRFSDKYGKKEKLERYPVQLKRGDNESEFNIPKLPGGLHLSDYRLMSPGGLIYDFGSYAFEKPAFPEIKQVRFSGRNPYYKRGEEIRAEVELANIEDAMNLSWHVEDTYNRMIKKGSQPLSKGQVRADIIFKVDYPMGILYHLFVRLEKNNEVENISAAEFSMPFNYPPADELLGYGWFAHQGSHGFKAWKENGFDVMVNGASRYTGLFKSLSAVNLRPGEYGLLYKIGDVDKGDRYRGDHGKEGDDTVRKPCYSDPGWWDKMKEEVTRILNEGNDLYYGVKDYSLGDECFLGSNVCFSEWCLKDFREYLKKQYKDLNELNKTWSTDFGRWEEVLPIQLKEVKKDKNNMAAWLDHKMFMTTVFARIGERMKDIVEEATPGMEAQIGFSGMQNPRYSYNWWELMKYMTSLQHYGGMQKDLIRSFRLPGTRYGLWVGYAGEDSDAEKYSRYHVWRGLFNQANGYMYYYAGYALLGDLSFARNTKYAIEELKEAKQGIDKMLLSSGLVSDIGLHYSHSSLFAGMATLGENIWSGAVNSWSAIINDLGLNFEFVSYEQLENNGLDKNKYRVFVLPVSVCLSDKETAALRKYVESGGILVADYGAGIYNGHGSKRDNEQICELFGMERAKDNEILLGGSGIKVREGNTEGLENRDMRLRFGEKGMRLTTGRAYGDTGDAKSPAVIINRFGKGKAIMLNCVLNDYAQVNLGGVGGEISEVKKGVLEINEQVKGLARDIFGMGGAVPEVLIETEKGVDLQSMTKTSVWKNGEINYAGLLNEPENMYSKILPAEATDIKILFKKKGHLYDVREKKYIGEISGNKQIEATIFPAKAKIYAILPYRVNGIEATPGKKSYKAGEVIQVSVKVKTSGGQAGNHVAYAEVVGPDKKARDYYSQKVIIQKGEGEIDIPTAFNDPTGIWSIIVRDVATGISKTVDIRIVE